MHRIIVFKTDNTETCGITACILTASDINDH